MSSDIQTEFAKNLDKCAEVASRRVPVMEEEISIQTPAESRSEPELEADGSADGVRASISEIRAALTLARLGDARHIARANDGLDRLERNFDRLTKKTESVSLA